MSAVPRPDPTAERLRSPHLIDSMIRMGARDPMFYGHALARLRQARGQTPDQQAADLGLTPSRLAALAMCKVPRPECREDDLAVVANHVSLAVADLERLLRAAGEAGAGVGTGAPKRPQKPTRLRLRRVEPGVYRSADGRVEIRREVSRQTYRADEVCWSVTIDNKTLVAAEATKRDAVRVAESKLKQAGGEA